MTEERCEFCGEPLSECICDLIADCQADARRDEQAYRELHRSDENG